MGNHPRHRHAESGSESEDGSASRRKIMALKSKRWRESEIESSEELDTEVEHLRKLLKNSGKEPDRNSKKKPGKTSATKTDKESKIYVKKSSKGNGQESDNEEEKEEDESAEHTKATQYTREQRKEVTRVRRCSRKDYYAILNLEKNCSQTEVKPAYNRSSLLTHPDRNKYPDAVKAFKLVSTAYQVLSDPLEREAYDRKRKSYKRRGELNPSKPWNEGFAENASGINSEPVSGSDDSEEEEEVETTEEWIRIYEEATPSVKRLFTKRLSASSEPKIKSINEKIEELNKTYNIEAEKYNREAEAKGKSTKPLIRGKKSKFITFEPLRAMGLEARRVVEALEVDPNDKWAKKKQKEVEKQLQKTIRINSYPQEWLGFLPWTREDNGKGQAEPVSPKQREKSKGREKPSSSKQKGRQSDTEMSDVEPSTKKKRKGKEREAHSSSKQKDEKSDVEMTDAVSTERHIWKPGKETRKGEKILGWRPFYQTDKKTGITSYHGCQFVIEKKGHPNPIALVSGSEVGRRVVDAYRDLPKKEQNDIRYSEEKYGGEDPSQFDKLLGFASKPFNTKEKGSRSGYPGGYGLYSFTDGTERIVSRSCLREVLGRTYADNEIEDFYKNIDVTPPWLVEPKKLLTSGSEVKRRSKSRSQANADDDSDYDSDSSSIFVSAKKKGRQRARDNGSSDSDSSRKLASAKKKQRRHARDNESSDNDSSSGDDSGDRQRQRRMLKSKKNSRTKKRSLKSNSRNKILADILQNFSKEMAEQNKRQEERMSKFEGILSQILVS